MKFYRCVAHLSVRKIRSLVFSRILDLSEMVTVKNRFFPEKQNYAGVKPIALISIPFKQERNSDPFLPHLILN